MQTLTACVLSLALIPALSFAENQANTTDCKKFAAEQLKEIKQDYYGALTQNESVLALEVAERSCRALYDHVEEERATFKAQPSKDKKVHWWEKEGKAKPTIKKAQQSGGK